MLFSLFPSFFWELRDKRSLKNLQFWPESLGAMLEYWYIERGVLQAFYRVTRHVLSRPLFPNKERSFIAFNASTSLPELCPSCLLAQEYYQGEPETPNSKDMSRENALKKWSGLSWVNTKRCIAGHKISHWSLPTFAHRLHNFFYRFPPKTHTNGRTARRWSWQMSEGERETSQLCLSLFLLFDWPIH